MVSRQRGLSSGFFVGGQRQRARRMAFVEVWQQAFEDADQLLRFLVAGAGFLALAVERAFDGGQIGERQFGHDRFDVRKRVDAARDMDDVFVVEAAYDIDDGVGFADVGQELVAQAFAFRGPGDQPGDIDELDDRRLDALRLDDGGQLLRGADRALRRCRRWARWCRRDSSRRRFPLWSGH
jgi:hypothetical protein